jgi:glycolate oxidase
MDRSLISALQAVVGKDYVLTGAVDLDMYSYDAGHDRHLPDVVVLPGKTEQIAEIVKLAAQAGLPVVARGAGTGLSGGSIPIMGGIVIVTSRLKRILEVNAEDRYAVVESGVINTELTAAAAPHGLYYAPDPSSQTVSTLGGNVAENAGGPHCLLYGLTSNHIMHLEVVLADGQVVQLGSVAPDAPGFDLRGVVIGSEGMFGIVTKITVRLMPKPEDARTMVAIYDKLEDAGETVTDLLRQGIIPAAAEIVDNLIARAVEAANHLGYPDDAGAVLLMEVDGLPDGLDELAESMIVVCRSHGAREVRFARTEEERVALWKGRKGAAGAIGRLAPSKYQQDATVPRSRLPEALHFIGEVAKKYNVKIGTMLHAGDGNLHPNILFDSRQPGIMDTVIAASNEITRRCVEMGGTITGEHGVGLEKQELMTWMFSEIELAQMIKLREAFDPRCAMNPGKVFPKPVTVSAAHA